jgi:two-component system phosphate regulon sensor histidine kinase PhoR
MKISILNKIPLLRRLLRRQTEEITDFLTEGVVVVDEHGAVTMVNPAACTMIGMPRTWLLKHELGDLPDPLGKKGVVFLAEAQRYRRVLTQTVITGKGVHLDLVVIPRERPPGAVLLLRDTSHHHRQMFEVGKEFIASASHELRTPITIVKGFAETLQDLPKISPPLLRDITDKIVRSCKRMELLVNNLLTLADLDHVPRSRFQECDLEELLERCCSILRLRFPTVLIDTVEPRGEKMVYADPDLLELAFMNLLENSVKYSTPPAHITLTLTEVADGAVEVAVCDRGIGIPEKDLPHIFDRFYTVNKAHSRKLGGAGLGLSIVKTIIEKHDGTITASSEVGCGTTFTVVLPSP